MKALSLYRTKLIRYFWVTRLCFSFTYVYVLTIGQFCREQALKKKREQDSSYNQRIQGHLICGGKEASGDDPARAGAEGKVSGPPSLALLLRREHSDRKHATRDLGDSGYGRTRITSQGRKCYRLKTISFL